MKNDSLKERLLELLYPQDVKCALCGMEALTENGICQSCKSTLAPSPNRPTPDGLDGFSAGLRYNAALRRTIHRFKYGNAPYLARFLASSIILPRDFPTCVIIPVPLHPSRLRARGYNQSELLAREFSQRTGLSVRKDLLRRVRRTDTQTELSEADRYTNVADAFLADPACKGGTFLLIDDVCTTGSTLSACAKALRAAGAAAVYGVSATAVTPEDSLT